MLYLLAASFAWAFSFGLIKHKLVAPGIDPNFVAFARLLLSFLLFLPWLRVRGMRIRRSIVLSAVGALQYGLMYVFYTNSFRFLPSHLVALLTILTPLYAALVHDILSRRFHPLLAFTALLAVIGTALVMDPARAIRPKLAGIILVQLSNLCFAAGQMLYRQIPLPADTRDSDGFALLYLSGSVVAAVPALISTRGALPNLSGSQALTILYLGLVPAGLCFFLWNLGARRANPGTLAVMNNAKIPLGILCSLFLFGEKTNLVRLALGGAVLVAAVALNEFCSRPQTRT